jgi:hypothetical protein
VLESFAEADDFFPLQSFYITNFPFFLDKNGYTLVLSSLVTFLIDKT